MCKIICITNRRLAPDFLRQIEKIAEAKPDMLILREKDLQKEQYSELSAAVLNICRANAIKCVFHTFVDVAKEQYADGIHLTLADLRRYVNARKVPNTDLLACDLHSVDKVEEAVNLGGRSVVNADLLGCSVHSVEEAKEAADLGASYLTAGHIFPTDCKKDLPPRGIQLIRNICEVVSIPVYALGGVNPLNAKECIQAGAAGVCMMSEFMQSESPKELITGLSKSIGNGARANAITISLKELASAPKEQYTLIDIRTPVSFQLGHITGAINLPFPQEAARLYDIPREKPVIVYCQKGEISHEIAELLVDAGYEAYNLVEGYLGWLMRHVGE
ncbi:hypothetical protein FACS1894111_01220 [Clostridia bacterium]|nr:hypothetical protein FACS1894111_01220 [Clostridia bacterium]